MTPSHAVRRRRELPTSSVRTRPRCGMLARRRWLGVPLIGALLLAATPAARRPSQALTVGLRYDIHMTTTTATSQDGQPAATANTALAHVEIVNGRVRIDVAEGEFAAIAGTGDFLLYTDTSHVVTLVKPDLKQYVQVDFQKLGTRLTGMVNLFGGAVGVQATNPKLDFASLGPGDKVGPFPTAKYRITQDYVLKASFFGTVQSGKGTTMHSTSDYWFAPQLTMIVNPFANFVQETAWLGPSYGQQLAALEAKLPKGVPVKTIATDVATDSAGAKSTTTVTWELTDFVRADVPDAAFQIPAGYTPMQAPTALVQPLVPLGTGNGNNAKSPLSGYVNGNALQAVGANGGATGALSTLIKAAQGGMPPAGANGSSAGAPTTTWNGNASVPTGGSNPWSAATSGLNASSATPAAGAQDTTGQAGAPNGKSRSP